MKSFKRYIAEAGQRFERQENALVKIVRMHFKKNGNKPFTLLSKDGKKIKNVVDAKKFTGRVSTGHEPYTDVQIIQANGRKVNLSNKGEAAPSVAGGGVEGLEVIVPGIVKKMFNAAAKWYKGKYKEGDYAVDLYAKVSVENKEKILVGTPAMGGPIHYMYVGPMDVKAESWDEKKQELRINGKLTWAKTYAKEYDIHYRIRKRRQHQRLDLRAKDRRGYPSLFVTPEDVEIKDPKTGKMKWNEEKYGTAGRNEWAKKQKREMNRRVVISKAPPKNANMVIF